MNYCYEGCFEHKCLPVNYLTKLTKKILSLTHYPKKKFSNIWHVGGEDWNPLIFNMVNTCFI